MPSRSAAPIASLAVALLALGCSSGKEDVQAGNLRTLTGEEVRTVLLGNTIVGQDELGPFWMHYPSKNTIWGLASNGDVDVGSWRIAGNHYCRAWRSWRNGAEQCWLFASDGSSQLIWIEAGGKSSGLSTIQAGNTIGRLTNPQMASALFGSDVSVPVPPFGEDTPIDPAGALLVARRPDSGSGKDPSGIDSGSETDRSNGGSGPQGSPGEDSSGGGVDSDDGDSDGGTDGQGDSGEGGDGGDGDGGDGGDGDGGDGGDGDGDGSDGGDGDGDGGGDGGDGDGGEGGDGDGGDDGDGDGGGGGDGSDEGDGGDDGGD